MKKGQSQQYKEGRKVGSPNFRELFLLTLHTINQSAEHGKCTNKFSENSLCISLRKCLCMHKFSSGSATLCRPVNQITSARAQTLIMLNLAASLSVAKIEESNT